MKFFFVGDAGKKERPSEIIAEALQAWDDGKSARADEMFRRGVQAYQSDEPDGTEFALGRYGAFLLDQGRITDAERVLQQAVELKTDIPAIWSDYIGIFEKRHDINGFKYAVAKLDCCRNGGPAAPFLLGRVRTAGCQGATAFAEELARWVIERCVRLSDIEGRWAATGDLGRILERSGKIEEAIKLWRDAFNEGSRDPETITRLAMHLERSKNYSATSDLIRDALARRLPASTEEALRKRLARCARKAEPAAKRPKIRDEIPVYSVREDSSLFKPIFQARLKFVLGDFAVVNNSVRCILTSRVSSTLVDFDYQNGNEVRRVENLPRFTSAAFSPDGRTIGVCRTAAVGQGPTLLRFLNATGQLIAESSVPDATSEVAKGPDLWYVGCRNGLLYAFGFDGRQHWAWETPGAGQPIDNVYFRPCPYYVSSGGSFAVIASMGNVYAVNENGKMLWCSAVTDERQTKWRFAIPVPGESSAQRPYKVLGLGAGASREQVKSAYRRLALETHPDRNPGDPEATANFRRVQEAYERVLASGVAGGYSDGGYGINIELEIHGMGPIVSFVNVTKSGAVVGSSRGRIYTFDGNGERSDARVIGDAAVRFALQTDGTIGAAWCGNTLRFFRDGEATNATKSVGWPCNLLMWDGYVVLWHDHELTILDTFGRTVYALEFSKSIAGVVVYENVLYCMAGALVAFRRGD